MTGLLTHGNCEIMSVCVFSAAKIWGNLSCKNRRLMQLIETLMQRFLNGHMLYFLLGKYLELKWLDHMVTFLRNGQLFFKRILLFYFSHQQCMRVLVPLLPGQHLACSFFQMLVIPKVVYWYIILFIFTFPWRLWW